MTGAAPRGAGLRGAAVQAGLPGMDAWPPSTRWPDAVHRGVAALRQASGGGPGGGLHDAPARRAAAVQAAGPAAGHDCAEDDGHTAAVDLLLAVSGGADSLALAVLAAVLRGTREGAGLRIGATVVDHGLQPGSGQVAEAAAAVCRGLGLRPVTVEAVQVRPDGAGPEAAARTARMAALAQAAQRAGSGQVATAHTADDQAEQVLLALARGSGPRSLAGIPARRPLTPAVSAGPTEDGGTAGVELVRPLLGLSRADTEAICAWAGVRWWSDPMNTGHDYRRVRVREHLLPLLEDARRGLGPGVRAGLVRTAAIAAEDAAALDCWAEQQFHLLRRDDEDADGLTDGPARLGLDLDGLAALPPAVRHRVYARAAALVGAAPTTRERLQAVDGLVTGAHRGGGSAGPVELGAGTRVSRRRREASGPGGGAGGCVRLEFHSDPAVD